MINKVFLIGRLGKTPELRYTPSGESVCAFSMATDEGFGEKKRAEWHNIVLWKKLAEVAGNYLFKGSLVYIEGRIQTRSYEGKDGVTKYITEVVGHRMQILSPRNSQAPVEANAPTEDEGDVPF